MAPARAETAGATLHPRQERMKATHRRSLRVVTTGLAFVSLGVMGCGESNGPNAVDPTANFNSTCADRKSVV